MAKAVAATATVRVAGVGVAEGWGRVGGAVVVTAAVVTVEAAMLVEMVDEKAFGEESP